MQESSGNANADDLAIRIAGMVGKDNMNAMLEKQEEILSTLKHTNRSLEAFNSFSASRYEENLPHVESYTTMLKEMKTDLEVIFKRIRNLKSRLATTYPEVYSKVVLDPAENEDDD
ncbi:hypothetical protein HDU97_006206 [Phlyctochytrium planicorne]|nr:hypothetical protein HDU97_006206 [Phlyctochytrium planicorne]